MPLSPRTSRPGPRPVPALLALLGLALLLSPFVAADAQRAAASNPAAPAPPPQQDRPVMPTPVPPVPFSVLSPHGNPNLGKGFTMALLDNNRAASGMGFNWVSYTVDWGTAEPNPGQYNWGDVDNIVNSVAQTNLRLLLRIGQSPSWANGGRGHGWYAPTNPVDFGVFAGQLAAHVRPRLAGRVAYEIWNEPNLAYNWGCDFPSPALYTGLLREAYNHIKDNDGTALVVGGAVTTVGALPPSERPTACSDHIDDLAFINGMYDAGAKPYFDVLSSHPYGFGDPPEANPRTFGRTLVFRRAELHREIMVQRGDSAKQIWATEMGWTVNPAVEGCTCTWGDCWYFIWSEQQQADFLVRAFQWARSYWDWMGAMFVFNYDFEEAPWYPQCHAFDFFGVKNRPAETALRNMVSFPQPTYTALPTQTARPTATASPTSAPDLRPDISAFRIIPPAVGQGGATVTLEVDATDPDATPIESAQFTLTFPDGASQVLPMTLVSGNAQLGTWRGSFVVPPNTSGVQQTYQVQACVIESPPPRGFDCADLVPVPSFPWRFADVPPDFWAYTPIEYLAGNGIVSGYADATFRPNNATTRSQFSKMIVLAEGWKVITPLAPTFDDVTTVNPFYGFVETAVAHNIISGYDLPGGGKEFRPFNNITRAQISKIIALAENWPLNPPANATFRDVLPDFWSYPFVEAAVERRVVSGYSCGAGCAEFRPNNDATRAQLSKMLFQAIEARSLPTVTSTWTASPTPSLTPTFTPTPTDTTVPKQTPTATPSHTSTATSTATATPTDISKPGGTSTPTPTQTPFIVP